MNGLPLGQTFQRHSAYVPQDDIFVPTLSAWETLQVCACFHALRILCVWCLYFRRTVCRQYISSLRWQNSC